MNPHWNIMFSTEIQDGCQWPYWKLPLRVILVLFVSEANVITPFNTYQGHWIHFWDLYGWNFIFAAEIQDGCQWPYWKLPLCVILVLFVSDVNVIPLFHIIQGHWIHFWEWHGWNVIFCCSNPRWLPLAILKIIITRNFSTFCPRKVLKLPVMVIFDMATGSHLGFQLKTWYFSMAPFLKWKSITRSTSVPSFMILP